jgi:hypothetical protein
VKFCSPGTEYLIDDSKVEINYTFEVDFRSWGISSIKPIMYGSIEIDTVKIDFECKETPISVLVDLSRLELNWVPGTCYRPDDILIYLNKDGKVDYTTSEIKFVFIDRNI